MYALDRLRRENIAIQTAINKRMMEWNDSQPYSTNASLCPSFGTSRASSSQLTTSDVENLLMQHSRNALENALLQNRQSQQLVAIRAKGSFCPSGISPASKININHEVSAALSHPLFDAMNGTTTSAATSNSSRLIQLADAINGWHIQSSLHQSGTRQPALIAKKKCLNPQDHSSREMEKARLATFAPVRKKVNEAEAKQLSKYQGEIDKAHKAEKKPSKNVTKWQTMLESLKQFKESHGHCIVPRGYEDMKLASWVVEQRKQYRRHQENLSSGIDQDRIDRLNDIGFTWDAQEAAWDRQMDHLREFHRIHGHCDVPRDNVQFPRLYLWIREQRRHYKLMKKGQSTLLTKARVDALKSVGFSFDSLGAIFTSRLQELSEFRRLHGHCHVPPGYSQNANGKLFGWIERMKKEYKLKMNGQKSTLSEAHVSALNELEFPWLPGKSEGSGKIGRKNTDDSTKSSHGEEYDSDSSDDDDTASILSSSSGSSVEVYKTCARPLKKRRLL